MRTYLFLLIVVLQLFACEDKAKEGPGELYISGTIIDEIDKLPIEGATVYVERASMIALDVIDTTIYTDIAGRFVYTILPVVSFTYQLDIRKEGYYGLTKTLDSELETQELTIELERYP